MIQIPYGELQIVSLTKMHELTSFYSTNADLNDFLKSDAIRDQENTAIPVMAVNVCSK